MNWTIILSAVSLILALMTASFKLANAINRSTVKNAESRAELTVATDALKQSLDEFKATSRAEHTKFNEELAADRALLAKQGAEIEAHEKVLNKHEKWLTKLEREKIK